MHRCRAHFALHDLGGCRTSTAALPHGFWPRRGEVHWRGTPSREAACRESPRLTAARSSLPPRGVPTSLVRRCCTNALACCRAPPPSVQVCCIQRADLPVSREADGHMEHEMRARRPMQHHVPGASAIDEEPVRVLVEPLEELVIGAIAIAIQNDSIPSSMPERSLATRDFRSWTVVSLHVSAGGAMLPRARIGLAPKGIAAPSASFPEDSRQWTARTDPALGSLVLPLCSAVLGPRRRERPWPLLARRFCRCSRQGLDSHATLSHVSNI